MNKALSGIRVLDFAGFGRALRTMNLADFGAEVIKIESLEQVMAAGSLARLSTDKADIIPW